MSSFFWKNNESRPHLPTPMPHSHHQPRCPCSDCIPPSPGLRRPLVEAVHTTTSTPASSPSSNPTSTAIKSEPAVVTRVPSRSSSTWKAGQNSDGSVDGEALPASEPTHYPASNSVQRHSSPRASRWTAEDDETKRAHRFGYSDMRHQVSESPDRRLSLPSFTTDIPAFHSSTHHPYAPSSASQYHHPHQDQSNGPTYKNYPSTHSQSHPTPESYQSASYYGPGELRSTSPQRNQLPPPPAPVLPSYHHNPQGPDFYPPSWYRSGANSHSPPSNYIDDYGPYGTSSHGSQSHHHHPPHHAPHYHPYSRYTPPNSMERHPMYRNYNPSYLHDAGHVADFQFSMPSSSYAYGPPGDRGEGGRNHRSLSPTSAPLNIPKHKSRKTWTDQEWTKLLDLAERSKGGNPENDIDWDFVVLGFGGKRARQGILTVASKRGLKVSTREFRRQAGAKEEDVPHPAQQ